MSELIQSYAGDPTSNVTPEYLGQFCHDTVSDDIYQANGLTSADWVNITGGGGDTAGGPIAVTGHAEVSGTVAINFDTSSQYHYFPSSLTGAMTINLANPTDNTKLNRGWIWFEDAASQELTLTGVTIESGSSLTITGKALLIFHAIGNSWYCQPIHF